MFHRLNSIVILGVVCALGLSACGPASTAAPTATLIAPPATPIPASTEAPAPTSTLAPQTGPIILRIGDLYPPDTLNPAYAFLGSAYTIFDLVYSSLVKEGLDGQYYGDLAANWSQSQDKLTWTFNLKEDLKYHNGQPLTAADVAWSINEIKNDPEGWAALINYTNGFVEAAAPNPQTVQITTEYPIPNMEYRVSYLYALWRPDYEAFTSTEALQNFSNENLIGSGAFKLQKWDKDLNIIILKANLDFYDGRPIVDQVYFQTFDNSDALVQALKVGDIDVINGVPNSAFNALEGIPNITAVPVPGRSFDELILNSVPADHDPAPTGHPALRDPQVRLAISYALDKKDLIDIVYQGLAVSGWSIVAPSLGGGFWHNPNIDDIPFDPDQANRILDEAGYPPGADGVREKDGLRLEMRLQYDSDSPEYQRNAELIAGWLADIGIKANSEAVDAETLTAAVYGIGDYDLVIWGWGGDPDPDFILSIMTCEQFVPSGWNDSGYCNPEYDQLYLDQQGAGGALERREIIWKMQELLFRDKPYIVLYNYADLYAYRNDRFTNFQMDVANPYIADTLVLQDAEPVR